MKKIIRNQIVIYQAKTGSIELRKDLRNETIWANLQQIADLFETDKSGISRHIKNIFNSRELTRGSTVAIFATVQKEGDREVKRTIEFYNLDMIISVGYRVNSKKATLFRKWATKILREHITQGYTINKKRIAQNLDRFLKAVNEVKALLPEDQAVDMRSVLNLVTTFVKTWLSLEAYDSARLPKSGLSKEEVLFTADELKGAILILRKNLISKKAATELFASERSKHVLHGIVGNIFQSFGGNDLYQTVEEKAAHLLYFMVKDHPFSDGNKRSGAFAFIWYLKKSGLLNPMHLTPETLTALTLLVAESPAKEKPRMIGLILLLLKK